MSFAATWTDLEIIPSEVNTTRERQISYDITYIWNLIYGINEPFHRKENHGLAEQTYGCQGGGIWMGGMLGVNRCKLFPL